MDDWLLRAAQEIRQGRKPLESSRFLPKFPSEYFFLSKKEICVGVLPVRGGSS